MSDDLGPGDCVEAVIPMNVQAVWTAPGQGPYVIAAGTRTVVQGLSPGRTSVCSTCRERNVRGLYLFDYPLMPWVAWCPCEWKKIGPGKEEHVKQFAEYTRQRDAEDIRVLVEGLPK